MHLEVRVGASDFEYALIHYVPAAFKPERSDIAYEEIQIHPLSALTELHFEPNGMLLQWLGELQKSASLPNGWAQLEKKTKFYQIINYLLASTRRSDQRIPQSEPERMVGFIRQHYMEPLTLTQLAEMSGYRPKYFSRLFQRFTGTSPMHYLIQTRMDIAYDMLSSGFYTVREAAEHVGYSDPYYFSRLFKARKNISSGLLREKNK